MHHFAYILCTFNNDVAEHEVFNDLSIFAETFNAVQY